MEEILASIRRIIADDQSLPLGRNGVRPHPAPQPAPTDEAVSQETVSTAQAVPEAPTEVTAPEIEEDASPKIELVAEPRTIPPFRVARTAPAAFRSASTDVATESRPAKPQPAPVQTEASHELATVDVAPNASADAAAAPETMVTEPLPLENAVEALPKPVESDGPLVSPSTDASVTSAFNALAATRLVQDSDLLQQMARDLLRPMLKAWLDDNLPVMVERLVRAEIERVARGGR